MSAYELIKEAILEGTYKPGERLTEENLASEHKLSRTPIREAIKRLELEGLVSPLKRGVIVKQFTKDDIRKIYDVRAMLEGYAASQAAIHRTAEDCELLRDANKPFIHLVDNYKQSDQKPKNLLMEANNFFHNAVFSASKNEHISILISKVVVVPLIYRSFSLYDSERLNHSAATHETIATAIINRDSERARTAMLENVYQGRDLVLRSLEAAQMETPHTP